MGFPPPTTASAGAAVEMEERLWIARVGFKEAAGIRKCSLRRAWASSRKSATRLAVAVAVMSEGLSCPHHDYLA